MARHIAPRGALRRVSAFAAAATAVIAALVVGAVSNHGGTYALWQDVATIPIEKTVASGAPGLAVNGFQDLDFDYTLLDLSTSTTVTVQNTGNVPLHSFSASTSLTDGSQALADAVTTTFTPSGGGPTATWSSWLSGLTLAPGATVSYTATTSLPVLDLALLLGQRAEVTAEVQATAGTSWNVTAQNDFTQTVEGALPPGHDDFNMSFTDYGGGHNVDASWSNPPGVPNTVVYHVWINGVLTDAQASYWWPHYSISTSNIPAQFIPAQGVTTHITVTVTADDDPTVIAQGTLWLTGAAGGDFTISVTNPGA